MNSVQDWQRLDREAARRSIEVVEKNRQRKADEPIPFGEYHRARLGETTKIRVESLVGERYNYSIKYPNSRAGWVPEIGTKKQVLKIIGTGKWVSK